MSTTWPAPTTERIWAGHVFPHKYAIAVDIAFRAIRGFQPTEDDSALIKWYFKTYNDLNHIPQVWIDLFPCEYDEVCEERD